MEITIHRGTKQIGGCVTEYEHDGWHLFVDYGEELPGGPKSGDLKVEGLTHGNLSKSTLLITHYHGDHIGCITKLPKELKIYMGDVARDIQTALSNHLKSVNPLHEEMLERLKLMQTFKEGRAFPFGPFNIMPITADHSAFDAYAFKITADGHSAYHSGDFRMHGFRSSKFPEVMKRFIGKVDCVVCEATNISRPNATSKTESALQRDFKSLFVENKKVHKGTVVYLSSTNIDRLFALYHAALEAKIPFYVDGYQKEIMDIIVNSDSIWTRSPLYQYGKYASTELEYNKHDKDKFFVSESFKRFLTDKGYVLVARANKRFDNLLKQIPGEKVKVLSMWDGYVREGAETYNENLASSLGEDYISRGWHTSGHVDMKDLREFFNLLQPKAIIPIHTDAPDKFSEAFEKEWPVVLLNDGGSYTL